MTSNDRVERIIDAIGELESNDELARVVGEGLQRVARLGRKAWEALFEMIDGDEEAREEIVGFFSAWIEKQEDQDADQDADD